MPAISGGGAPMRSEPRWCERLRRVRAFLAESLGSSGSVGRSEAELVGRPWSDGAPPPVVPAGWELGAGATGRGRGCDRRRRLSESRLRRCLRRGFALALVRDGRRRWRVVGRVAQSGRLGFGQMTAGARSPPVRQRERSHDPDQRQRPPGRRCPSERGIDRLFRRSVGPLRIGPHTLFKGPSG